MPVLLAAPSLLVGWRFASGCYVRLVYRAISQLDFVVIFFSVINDVSVLIFEAAEGRATAGAGSIAASIPFLGKCNLFLVSLKLSSAVSGLVWVVCSAHFVDSVCYLTFCFAGLAVGEDWALNW